MLLNLSFNYFFMFVGVVVASLAVLLSGISGPKVFFLIILNTVAYMSFQCFDRTNFFEEIHFRKLPKYIDNDLYKLKHGTHQFVKKSSNSKDKR